MSARRISIMHLWPIRRVIRTDPRSLGGMTQVVVLVSGVGFALPVLGFLCASHLTTCNLPTANTFCSRRDQTSLFEANDDNVMEREALIAIWQLYERPILVRC